MRFPLDCTCSHLDRGNSFFVNLGVVLTLGTKVLYICRARWFQPEERPWSKGNIGWFGQDDRPGLRTHSSFLFFSCGCETSYSIDKTYVEPSC